MAALVRNQGRELKTGFVECGLSRFTGLWRRARASGNRLDIDAMSDWMKRDLGFLDGRGPKPRPERYR